MTSVSGSCSMAVSLCSRQTTSSGPQLMPKLQLKVSTAGRQWSTPAMTRQPTLRKPSENPPAPQYKSSTVRLPRKLWCDRVGLVRTCVDFRVAFLICTGGIEDPKCRRRLGRVRAAVERAQVRLLSKRNVRFSHRTSLSALSFPFFASTFLRFC